jgi:hypothetical protein
LIYKNTKYFIDDRIFTTKFHCDLSACRGGCCTIRGYYGAPLKEEEINLIKSVYSRIEKYISERNKKEINERGFFFREGEKIYLNNVNDEDCVFSYITEGIAKCSFEKAYKAGEIDFKKPVSCELFPIRVSGEKNNVLRFDKMTECEDALDCGIKNNTSVFEFVKEAIERNFGKEFYINLNTFYKDK